jgi:hypothetical protein
MKQQIESACESLKEAMLAEYDASQMELESKVAKTKTHNDVLIAKDALRDISIY